MKAKPIIFTASQHAELADLVRRGRTENRVAQRARMVMSLMDGKSGNQVSREMGCEPRTVYRWRDRFLAEGISGLRDAPRPGRPLPAAVGEDARRIIDLTIHHLPKEASRWNLRLMARYAGTSKYRVETVWKAAKLRPHMVTTFNFSSDPDFIPKLLDIVGLYMRPPVDAIILSLDEKTQIQALDHTQPMLQLRPGQIERHTHDYERHGVTNLFAAMDVGTGKVVTELRQRHRAKEFVSFLSLLDRRKSHLKCGSQIHVILDNSSIHKTEAVRKWLETHPNFHFHFTPTSSSWLNAVENFFARVERYGLNGMAFKSLQALKAHLEAFFVTFNRKLRKPFVWKKEPDAILDSIRRATAAVGSQTERSVLG